MPATHESTVVAFHASNRLDAYLRKVRGARRLDRSEELTLVRRYREHRDLAAQSTLLTANLDAVVAIAFKYRRYGVPLDELIGEGNLAVVHALSKFDTRRETRFMTYAAYWVRAYVLNRVIRSYSMVGGSGALRSKMFFRLRRERTRCLNLVGDAGAADALLATSMGLRIETVREMIARLDSRDVSLEGGTGPEARPLVDVIRSNEPLLEEALEDRETGDRLRRVAASALAVLDERERFIAENRFLADEEDQLSLAKIGRHLGISRERARQLEARAKQKLRSKLKHYARQVGYS